MRSTTSGDSPHQTMWDANDPSNYARHSLSVGLALAVKLAGDHWIRFRKALATDETRAVSAVGFTAVVVLFLAGLFEFNFGDSEVLMVFLFLASAPYALSNLSTDRPRARQEAQYPGGPSHGK